ncbi:hypothetical protein GOODEAATRI_010881 [Goodea atripinnis]|uniref:Uncharacterized protein n=1 Tax=Goodea atripinnis TaxID=208336 RepID=A0ABV0N9M8_9TELE
MFLHKTSRNNLEFPPCSSPCQQLTCSGQKSSREQLIGVIKKLTCISDPVALAELSAKPATWKLTQQCEFQCWATSSKGHLSAIPPQVQGTPGDACNTFGIGLCYCCSESTTF